MVKKIILLCLLFSIKNIFYADHTNDHINIKKNQVINNELTGENNQGMLRVEIPRRRQNFDSIQVYLDVIHDSKKNFCNCSCKENVGLCGAICLSFVCLKCLLG